MNHPGIPGHLATLGLSGINRDNIGRDIRELAHLAARLERAPAEETRMARYSCESAVQLAENYLSHRLDENPTIHLLGFLTLLQRLRLTLTSALQNLPASRIDGTA